MERYSYRTLDRRRKEIRVLDVLPGTGKQTIRCKVRHVSLDSTPTPKYEAISYCWDDASLRWYVIADGSLLNVPSSAAKALARMRRKRSTRTLWIDAVCINQNNRSEREWQVGLMKDVFSATVCCLVYLGDGGRLARPASTSVQILHDLVATSLRTSPLSAERQEVNIPETVRTAALAALFMEPWFTRLWVLQEVLLPPQTICHWGALVCDLNMITRVAGLLIDSFDSNILVSYKEIGEGLLAVIWTEHILVKNKPQSIGFEGCSLYDLYNFTTLFRASDSHDYVYGMLGLCRTETIKRSDGLLEPKYTKGLRNVFRDATRAAIKESESLSILTIAPVFARQSTDTALRDCLSWVVAWGHYFDDTSRVSFDIGFAADNESPIIYEECALDKDLLQLGGVEACQITSVSPPGGTWHTLTARTVADTIDFCTSRAERPGDYGSQIHVATDIGPALVSGRNIGRKRTSRQAYEDMLALREHIEQHGELPEYSKQSYASDLKRMLRNRRAFVTTLGQVGIGPDDLEVDDKVVVLYGGDVPFILRPVGDEYRLIGLCYLQGIMNGEVVIQHKAEGKEDTIFKIR